MIFFKDRMSDGHNGNKPNMESSVLTIVVQLTTCLRFLCQLFFSDRHAELPPMLTVAATCLGYTANDPNKKEENNVGRGVFFKFYAVQKTQCLRQHAPIDSNMTH